MIIPFSLFPPISPESPRRSGRSFLEVGHHFKAPVAYHTLLVKLGFHPGQGFVQPSMACFDPRAVSSDRGPPAIPWREPPHPVGALFKGV